MGWNQRFDKCQDRLMLRVGGPGGPLIHWPDRGQGGQCTWSAEDPVGETRDISAWVGNAPQIRLYAMIFQVEESGDKQCEMVTLYGDEMRRQWQFDSDEDHEIERPEICDA